MNLKNISPPYKVMFNSFEHHFVEHGFCCFQITILQHDRELDHMMANRSNIYKSLLYSTRSMKWDIVHENELLIIKFRNDLGLNEFSSSVTLCAMAQARGFYINTK